MAVSSFSAVFSDWFLFDRLFGIEGADAEAARYLAELRLSAKVTIENGRFSTTALSLGQRKRMMLLVAYLEDRPVYLFPACQAGLGRRQPGGRVVEGQAAATADSPLPVTQHLFGQVGCRRAKLTQLFGWNIIAVAVLVLVGAVYWLARGKLLDDAALPVTSRAVVAVTAYVPALANVSVPLITPVVGLIVTPGGRFVALYVSVSPFNVYVHRYVCPTRRASLAYVRFDVTMPSASE